MLEIREIIESFDTFPRIGGLLLMFLFLEYTIQQKQSQPIAQRLRFASFLSGGFISKSTGKETGKTHLCALSQSQSEPALFCEL